MIDPGSPAFPIEANKFTAAGLTKREYFAALAMNGLCASSFVQKWLKGELERTGIDSTPQLIVSAIHVADLMLKELAK